METKRLLGDFRIELYICYMVWEQLDLDCQTKLLSVEGARTVPRFETVFDLNGPNRPRLQFVQPKMLLRLLIVETFNFFQNFAMFGNIFDSRKILEWTTDPPLRGQTLDPQYLVRSARIFSCLTQRIVWCTVVTIPDCFKLLVLAGLPHSKQLG